MNDLIAEPFINPQGDDTKAPGIMEFEQMGDVRYYHHLPQGTDEWLKLRLGMLTASEISKVLTPTLKVANNADTRKHIFDLAAQRITKHVEPHFESWDMRMGHLVEIDARQKYSELYAPVKECGFIINDSLGFEAGMSPDGLVGDLGQIEVKSRMAKYQVQTILEHIAPPDAASIIPMEYMLQVQDGLFITGREWCDFISYSNGLNMAVIRVRPIEEYQVAIKKARIETEAKLKELVETYTRAVNADGAKIHPVARNDYNEEME